MRKRYCSVMNRRSDVLFLSRGPATPGRQDWTSIRAAQDGLPRERVVYHWPRLQQQRISIPILGEQQYAALFHRG